LPREEQKLVLKVCKSVTEKMLEHLGKDQMLCPYCAYDILLTTLLHTVNKMADLDTETMIHITMDTLAAEFDEIQVTEVNETLPH